MTSERQGDDTTKISRTLDTTTISQTLDTTVKTDSFSESTFPENEATLIQLLNYWIPRTMTPNQKQTVPKDHEELVGFINQLFASFKREEQECWNQLNNLHLMTPQMLHLYQKKFVKVQKMNWIQILCYKTVSCPRGKDCSTYREQKMLHNQFYDFELECPYFHNIKDKRRIVLPTKPDEEFIYKGKYRDLGEAEEVLEDIYSHNYFESVYHPLFYKFFDCKRLQCKGSIYCPMKHSEEERVAWEEEFSLCWRKDRSIYYPKKNKNLSEYSELGFEDRPVNQHKYFRNSLQNPMNNLGNMNYNQQQQIQFQAPNMSRKDQGNNMTASMSNCYNNSWNHNAPQDNSSQKRLKYRHNVFEPQQSYPQFQQEVQSPVENFFSQKFSPQGGTIQYDQQGLDFILQASNLPMKHSNSTPVNYSSIHNSQYPNFNGYASSNTMPQYQTPFSQNGNVAFNTTNAFQPKAKITCNDYSSAQKNYYGNLSVNNYDEGCDFEYESLFSTKSQYSYSSSTTNSEDSDIKQLITPKNTPFYSKQGNIEVD